MKSFSCEAGTSSWWAIQASVRPCRTQARIWLSWGLSDFLAIGGPTLANAGPLDRHGGSRYPTD